MNIQSNPLVQRIFPTLFGVIALLAQSGCTDPQDDLEFRGDLFEPFGIDSANFPYLNQNDIPNIGWAACSSASAAMVLAYDGKIEPNQESMISAAEYIFSQTANLDVGLVGAQVYIDHLEDKWGYSSVVWEAPNQKQLFDLLLEQLEQGRPVILGSKPGGINDAGHYMVVLTVDSSDYKVANIIIADPNGVWTSYNNWDEGANGLGVEQSFVDFTIATAAGIFILEP